MNTPRRRLNETALVCALLLGVLADLLVRVPGRPGLNVMLWALAGAAVLWLLCRRFDVAVSRETKWLVGAAVGFAGLLVLRDAEALAVFCMFSAVVLLGLAAGRGTRAWAAQTEFVDLAAAAVRVGTLIVLGPFGWTIGHARESGPAASGGRVWSRARIAARGTVMALPLLLVLTALLTSADPMFERVLHNALFTGVEPALEHAAFAGLIGWFTSGYLRACMVPDEALMARVRVPRPALAPAEITVALSLLNVLFMVFLAVQIRYLFGGADLVEVTEGLTYAEYARRGFFELVAATTLVVPVLLVADWAARDEGSSRRMLRATSGLLVVLLLGVLASAAFRMKLYQDAYGLTEDRLYGSTFMIWLVLVLGLLALTVLRGSRRGFAFGAIVAGLACIAALHAVNPHALIARVNIARAATGAAYDGRYLSTLSADAAPTLIDRLPSLPQGERCRVKAMLEKRWGSERTGGWRTFNVSDARARRLVARMPAADCPK